MNSAIKRKFVVRAAAISMIGISAMAVAHHSTAMYDYQKSMTLTGTVTEFQWTNPHMFIQAKVLDASGKHVEWSIECGTPNINARHGWKKSDIKAGDRVVMDIHPMRNGTAGGTLVTVKLADGRTLYGPGNDIVAFPPGGPGGAPEVGPGPASTR